MAIDRDAFDLFAFLGVLSRRDQQAYEKLSDAGKKAASPLVIMRWMAGTSDRAQIVRLNTFANRYVFSLGDEKPLLFKLLAASATGSTNRYSWLKGPTSASKKLAVQAVKEKYDISGIEAEEYLALLKPEDIQLFAEELGWTKEDQKKLQGELEKDGTESRGTKKVVSKSKK